MAKYKRKFRVRKLRIRDNQVGFYHGLQALFLGAIGCLESTEGQTLLELYAVDGHGTPLVREDRSQVRTKNVKYPHQNWFFGSMWITRFFKYYSTKTTNHGDLS
jgi:hypothetical protein